MPKFKLYISSTFRDLKTVRCKILDKIHYCLGDYFEFTEIMEAMRGEDGSNDFPVDTCLDNVRKANVYILLIGRRYGSSPTKYTHLDGTSINNLENKSYTQLEYEIACEASSSKLLKIYTIQLTDRFFEQDGFIDTGPLEDDQLMSMLRTFKAEVGIAEDNLIDNLVDFQIKINNILTRANLELRRAVELKLSDSEKLSIDRKYQKQALSGIHEDSRKVIPYLITTKGEEDDYQKFSVQLRNSLIKSTDQVHMEHFEGNQLAGTGMESLEKQLVTILRKFSLHIFGEPVDVDFKNLYEEMKSSNALKNRVLPFVITYSRDAAVTQYVQVVGEFIKKLNRLLTDNSFNRKFFVPIYFIDKEDNDANKQVVLDQLRNLTEYYDLGRLTQVELSDANYWLNEIINQKKIEFSVYEQNELLNNIFIDQKSFPLPYKKCFNLIDSRTK